MNGKGSIFLLGRGRKLPASCLAGYMNLLGFVKMATTMNPMLPEQAKEKIARLDPQNTSVQFQVSLNDQLHATGQVPLKLLREMGRLKD